ncbi:MAG: 4Fe-4S binding protein, partial [Magnetococcales bacterium]|nr:4Fe-4S binding protein [Magnetococcales bacterium]
LGGVESGLPEEMLRYPIQQLTLVEEDATALAMLQPWLPASSRHAMQDSRFSLLVTDGRAFVQKAQANAFDLVIILSGEPVNARQNRLHTHEFHRSLARILSPAGVVCTAISSASNYMGHEIISYSATMDRTLALTFPHRSVAPGDKQLFCAASQPGVVTSQPSLLAKRHQQFQPEGDNLPAIAFLSLLPTEQTRTLRQQLDKAHGEINSDQRPVHFYLNLLLWSKLTHSEAGNFLEGVRRLGSWPFLLPVLLYFLFLSLTGITGQRSQQNWQRNSAMAGVAMGGLAAMGLQLMVLYGFQAMVGAVFSQIALLNGLFMAGLALGAWLMGQRWQLPLWPMVLLLLFIALLALALPHTLASLAQQSLLMRQAGCWGLSLVLGVATGTIFPLGVALTNQQQAMTASGLVEAADHWGGALGGLFTGSLLIPLLGMEQTGVVIALFTTLAAGSLLLSDRWSLHHALPQFRWSPLAMLLVAVALVCWLLAILQKEMQPPPQSRFTPEVLQEVTGNNDLAFYEDPFPHYLRSDQMVLASQPVAGEIRGYAGTLNLLVALDHKGRLLAARHLHSHETPSYIEEVDIWLEGLQGHDFSRSSLQEVGVDGMSGATITSKAALAILDSTARQALQQGFLLQLTPQATTSRNHHPWLYPLALLFLLLIPVVWRQRERERLLFLALSLLLLGFVTNALWHEVDVANLSLGRWPSWSSNPLGTLMALAGVGMTLLFGQLYCGFLCPFGALQEFFSRVGKWLGWRRSSPHDALAPWWRGGVMVGSFSLFWWTDTPSWISFNPMQSLFSDHLSQWLAGLAVLSLLASLFFFRYWCRWWCPLGAILSLGNRFALLARLLPHRRISHCDVAVESSWDGGCLHCYRCLPEHELHNSLARQGQNVDNRKLPVLWLLFTVVTLALLMIHWQDALEASSESPGGWRRVDVDTLQHHIRQQRLSDREAMWYRKVP